MSNFKMGVVYSDPVLAIDGGLDYFKEEEVNVYVCPITFPSGVEYHLKKKILPDAECLKRYELTPRFRFQSLQNAINAIGYFKKRGKKYCVKKKFEFENGYKFVKYHYLCLM